MSKTLQIPEGARIKGLPERRFHFLELRVDKAGKRIEGYAAVFNKLSVDLGGFREQIQPGAFAETIEKDDVRALFNHDPNFVLGRNVAGTLELAEDNSGLHMRITPPDAEWARGVVASIKRGDITGASFGFRTLDDKWDFDQAEQLVRTLIRAKLFDVGPVTFPAYPDTEVGARALGLDPYGGAALAEALRALHAGSALTEQQTDLVRRYAAGLNSRLAARSTGQEPEAEPAGTKEAPEARGDLALRRLREAEAEMELRLRGAD